LIILLLFGFHIGRGYAQQTISPAAGRVENNAQEPEETEPPANDTIQVEALLMTGRDHLRLHPYVLDTLLNEYQIHSRVLKKSFSTSYLGNYGTSYISNLFFLRPDPSGYLFTEYLNAYFNRPEDIFYFRTRTPYSLISYTGGGSRKNSEQTLHFVHTQNVSKNLNLGIRYNGFSSNGFYPQQNTSNNVVSFFGSFDNQQYSLYGNLNLNYHKMKENGGLQNFSLFEDPENRKSPEAQLVNLSAAKTLLNTHNAEFQQIYRLGKYGYNADSVWTFLPSRFAFEHILRFQVAKRKFQDGGVNSFFPDPQYDFMETTDSSSVSTLSNALYIVFNEQARKRLTAGFRAGVILETDKYGHSIRPDTLFRESVDNPEALPEIDVIRRFSGSRFSSVALSGAFYNLTGKRFNWDIGGRFYLGGYKAADFELNGVLTWHFNPENNPSNIVLKGSIKNQTPGYFVQEYASNYFIWQNNFNKTTETKASGEYIHPFRNLKAGIYLSRQDEYIYFDEEALPQQFSEGIFTAAANLEKLFRVGHFGFRLKGTYQVTSEKDILPLPDFSGYQSSYFETDLVKNVLTMQVGYDLYYHTGFYAYAYQPATGIFMLQKGDPENNFQKKKVGNYPFLDLFLNLKLKRTRIFLKYEHMNADLMPGDSRRQYYTSFGYPEHPAMFKLGVSWGFYD